MSTTHLLPQTSVDSPNIVEDSEEHNLVLKPWLYIGDKAAAKDLEFLTQAGIRNIVNCTPERKNGGLNNYFKAH